MNLIAKVLALLLLLVLPGEGFGKSVSTPSQSEFLQWLHYDFDDVDDIDDYNLLVTTLQDLHNGVAAEYAKATPPAIPTTPGCRQPNQLKLSPGLTS